MQLWRLQQRVHVSWMVAVICLFFVIGVWTAQYISLSGWWVIVGGVFGFFGFLQRKVVSIMYVVIAGTVIGMCYGSTISNGFESYRALVGQNVTLTGKVKEDPSLTSKRLVVFQLDQVRHKDISYPGSIWVSVTGQPKAKRGDVVTITGEAQEGFGTFPLSLTMARVIRIDQPVPGDIGRVVRDWFAEAVRKGIPEPAASLGIGYLTGQKSALPPDLANALQIAGLSHIVVASGYNLTILVRLSRRLFIRVSKFLSLFASGIMIASFIMITGLSPSMTRAGLVSSLSLLTWYYGRQFHPFVLLPFAAAITVVGQPSYAWGDLGWQLSFAAFAGVMIVAPLIQRYFFGEVPPGTIRQVFGETVAAHLVTIPIVVPAFGLLSNVAIPANILIVPLVPLAMLLTFLTGVIGLAIPDFADIAGLPATWLLQYMIFVAETLADVPWAQTTITPTGWMVAGYVIVLVVVCFYMQRKTQFNLRGVNIIE
ncbi:ComEC/Rec2 family competence protein [Candidatus Saccharibacteria bacterium]|nr:ComEC/Rec2 family competence protein [Candidatus Saccharibacteria bacterium]